MSKLADESIPQTWGHHDLKLSHFMSYSAVSLMEYFIISLVRSFVRSFDYLIKCLSSYYVVLCFRSIIAVVLRDNSHHGLVVVVEERVEKLVGQDRGCWCDCVG